MKPPPKNWPRISSALFYRDPHKAIEWLGDAFGFEVIIKVEGKDGSIEHSELGFGGGLIMVAGEREWRASPQSTGAKNTQTLCIYVDDVDAHCTHARSRGAKIVSEPKTSDYGEEYWTDRGYEAEDLEGHHFWFVQRLRDQK